MGRETYSVERELLAKPVAERVELQIEEDEVERDDEHRNPARDPSVSYPYNGIHKTPSRARTLTSRTRTAGRARTSPPRATSPLRLRPRAEA